MAVVARPTNDQTADRDVLRRLSSLEAPKVPTALQLAPVTADPVPLVDGLIWIRSDLGKLCFQQSGTTTRLP